MVFGRRNHWIHQSNLLMGAWTSLLLPLGGLVYLTRDVLFDTGMPLLVLILIWNLLITYSLFGVVSTIVYATRMGRRSLPLLLDFLNLTAKFPLPIVILTGFITRPATTRFCFS